MAVYRYQFADLLTDQDIVSLELEDVRFDRRIIQPGSFSARIPVPNGRVAARVRRVIPTEPSELRSGPGRTVVHIYRDRDLWGTYLIWSAIPQGDDRGDISVEIQGASLESYLHHVEIREDLTYTQIPQELIAADLITHMQSDPHADISLTIGVGDSGAQPRDRTYKRSEAATYGQRATELASVDGGFEWMVKTYHVGQERRREFVTGEPLNQGGQDHIWTRPGNILRYRYLLDATDAATSWQARGDTVNEDLGQDSEPLMSAAYGADDLLAAGWPRLDATIDRSSVILTDTLEEYARWYRDHRSGVVRIPEITVRLDDQTRFSPNALGSWARTAIVDAWHPLRDGRPSYSPRLRIVGCEIVPPSRDSGQEECRLIAAEEEEVN